MFQGLRAKVNVSNLLIERGVKMLYTILNLYLGANFLSAKEFLILQQIVLFQSFLLFAISLPFPAIMLRIGNSSMAYFKSLIPGTIILRALIGIVLVCAFSTYLYLTGYPTSDVAMISAGLLPVFLTSLLFVEILPHVLNFEGKKNWELILILTLFFIIKCGVIIFLKSISFKIVVEIVEATIIVGWMFYSYLRGSLFRHLNKNAFKRVHKLVKSSMGLYFNGILSVFILRIDQFALIKYVDKGTLSNYMLIVSISSLFLIPMGLISERLGFTLNISKSKSFNDFKKGSYQAVLKFIVYSTLLFACYCIFFRYISLFLFKRDLSDLYLVGIILGFSIISNSIGMVLGQVNSIMNGGVYTMKRSLAGCILMFVGVNVGYQFFGILGVSIVVAFTLFLTNIVFWFFSKKIRAVFFGASSDKLIV